MKGLFRFLKRPAAHPPHVCVLCGIENFHTPPFCEECERALPRILGRFCPKCGRRTVTEGLCVGCKEDPPAWNSCRAVFDYLDPVTRLVGGMKFRNERNLCRFLAKEMAFLWKRLGKTADAVTYVPMTERAERKRGYNQAKLLAEEVAKEVGLPLISALRKGKESKSQRKLGRAERLENLRGCFSAAPVEELRGKRLILVDDVITTGSTLHAAAKALKRKAVAQIDCLTLAATPDPAVRALFLKEQKERKKKPKRKRKKVRKKNGR